MKRRRHLSLLEFLSFVAIIVILGWMLPAPAHADDVTLTWTNPVENEDGTPLTDLAGIRIWQLVGETTDIAQLSYTISGLEPGDYTYIATAYTTGDPVADPPVASVESKISNTAEKTVSALAVTDERVYIVAKVPGRFLFLVVGTVPLGTVCDASVNVGAYNSVPISEVTFTGARDVIVVAQCG